MNLGSIDEFWSEDVAIDTSFDMGFSFEKHSGFIEGIRPYSDNGQVIWISVFKTQEDAVNAMEMRINEVACIHLLYRFLFDLLCVLNEVN